jgi:hypothetical protein
MIPFLAAAVVSGPITGGDRGQAFGAMPAGELSRSGYTESEFFLGGTAHAFKPAGPLGVDGRWTVAPESTADYKVRMLVRRPADAKRFNGIVVVEWLNVTALAEGAADFMQSELTAQRPQGLGQIAVRLARPPYINAVHLLTRVLDGYLVHSRGANASGFKAEGLARDAENPVPPGAHLREDIDVPVLDLQTEGDLVALRAHLTHQPPFPHYRRWEIAGAAHVETPRWVAEVPPALDMGQACKDPVNSAPHHAVVKAALAALTDWVRSGKVPPQSPAIELGDAAAPDPIARDARGLAKGGIRLPEVEAPTATIDGGANTGAQETAPGAMRNFCFLFGRTKLFDEATLKSLYPNHDEFVKAFTAAADALETQGYLLEPEADAARKAAQDSQIGR